MNYKTITHANKKSSLIITVRKNKKWIDSTLVKNNEWVYFLPLSGLAEESTDKQLMFVDAVENVDVVLDAQDEKNIVQINGCIHSDTLSNTNLLTAVNNKFEKKCEIMRTNAGDSKMDECLYQYIKRQYNSQRVRLNDVLSDFLNFTEITTGQMSKTKLNRVRSFWMSNIKKHQKKSINYLNDELQAADDQEIVEEINKIISLVENVSVEAKEHLDGLEKFDHVVKYWPNLLLPAPEFVVK